MAGRVHVDGAPATKAGTPTADDAAVELIAPPRFVSRGGEKLESALAGFGVGRRRRAMPRRRSLDGRVHRLPPPARRDRRRRARRRAETSSTSAFAPTRGSRRIDGTNARSLDCATLPFRPTFVTADVSFISLRLVLPAALACAEPTVARPRAREAAVRGGPRRRPSRRRPRSGRAPEGVAGIHRVCDRERLGRPRRVRFLCPGAGRESRVHGVPRVARASPVRGANRRCRRPDRTCRSPHREGVAVGRAAFLTHGRARGHRRCARISLRAVAARCGVEIVDEHDPDIVVVLGGDGTMLRALQGRLGTGIPCLGVNFGRVGFLASIAGDDFELGLERAFAGGYEVLDLPDAGRRCGRRGADRGERHRADERHGGPDGDRRVERRRPVARRAGVRRRDRRQPDGLDGVQPVGRRPGARPGHGRLCRHLRLAALAARPLDGARALAHRDLPRTGPPTSRCR